MNEATGNSTMSTRTTQHGSFVIERTLAATAAQVFAAWAKPAAKARWFIGPEEWRETEREFDFRIGGRERLVGVRPGGLVSTFNAVYQDIVPDQRIIYTYDMHQNETRISVSLSTVELKAEGAETRLIYTEQAVYLDEFDDAGGRERGTREHLKRLAAMLQRELNRT